MKGDKNIRLQNNYMCPKLTLSLSLGENADLFMNKMGTERTLMQTHDTR